MISSLAEVVGDLSGHGSETGQIRDLVDSQESLWNTSLGSWVVVPVPGQTEFGLLAQEVEGERQGREVIRAFVGPALATLSNDSKALIVDGVACRFVPILIRPDRRRDFVSALESMTTTRLSIDRDPYSSADDESDLLRDMRLAIFQQDYSAAETAFERLRSLGTISQENMRFLNIELLAGQARWQALAALPYFEELQKTRRPKSISEFMLEAIWQTQILSTGRPPVKVFDDLYLQEKYGPLLGSVDIPSRRGALALAFISARHDGNQARVERQLSAASEDDRLFLQGLTWDFAEVHEPDADPVQKVHRLFGQQQYLDVVGSFLAEPQESLVDVAVNSVLELDDNALAESVLGTVRTLMKAGMQLSRGLSLLLPHLESLASNACGDWIHWITRVASPERWSAAAKTARENSMQWPEIPASEEISVLFANKLLESIEGVNGDQVRATLDLLCDLAANSVKDSTHRKLVEAVLLSLAIQDNAGESVRNAFNDLAWVVLDSTPDPTAYKSLLATASDMWLRIASLVSLDWALGLLDGFVIHPSPAPDDRRAFAMSVVSSVAKYAQRLEPSQVLSLRTLLEEIGESPWPDLAEEQIEDDPWSKLESVDLGIYTLFESEVPKLRQRLGQLTRLKSLTHSKDHVGTTALRNLAASSEYMIVDTWHAKHAATEEIDKVRPRSKQIIPRRGGALAWLQALKDYVTADEFD